MNTNYFTVAEFEVFELLCKNYFPGGITVEDMLYETNYRAQLLQTLIEWHNESDDEEFKSSAQKLIEKIKRYTI